MKTWVKIALIAWLWLLTINTGMMETTDTYVRVQMAHAWVTGQPEIPENYQPSYRGDPNAGILGLDRQRYSSYDVGQSLLILPSNWLGMKLGRFFPELAERQLLRFWVINFVTFIPLNVAVIMASFWLLRLFNFSAEIAGISSLCLLLGTTVLSYAQVAHQNNQVLLFVILGHGCILSYLQKAKPIWLFLAGLCLGLALLIRSTSIIHLLTVGLFLTACLIYRYGNLSKITKLISFYLLGLIPFSLLGNILNYFRLGIFRKNPQMLGKEQLNSDPIYAQFPLLPDNYPFVKPMSEGILGVLLSPGKSIFIYDPLLIPGLIILGKHWRNIAPYLKLYLLSIVLNIALFTLALSRVTFWHGDSAWGARYQITSVHLLMIPLLALFVQEILISQKIKKILLIFVLLISLFIQGISVTLPYNLPIRQEMVKVNPEAIDVHDRNMSFRLVRQLENLIVFWRYQQENQELEQLSEESQIAIKYLKITFLPFTFRDLVIKNNYQSLENLSRLLIIMWWLIFALAIVLTMTWLRKALL
mgnify:CR=1 FL=1